MSDKEKLEYNKKFAQFLKDCEKDEEKGTKLLVNAGILTEDGKLKKRYKDLEKAFA